MPSFRLPLLALALATLSLPAFAATAPYEIDPRHTQVLFTYSHMGMSHITGRFGDVSGTIALDADKPAASSVNVTIPVDSLSTGVPKLDEHMKSPDMFDAAQFPTATFASTSVKAVGKDHLQVTGNLTLHGVTRPVVLDTTINFAGPHPMNKAPAAGFDATANLKRSDFGIGYGLPNVGDEVQLRITVEAKGPKAE
jgi:polyisoprenoid-binding protein YceI